MRANETEGSLAARWLLRRVARVKKVPASMTNAQEVGNGRVAAGIAEVLQFAEKQAAGEPGISHDAFAKIGCEGIDHRLTRLARSVGRSLEPARNVFAHRLAVDPALPGDRRHRQALPMQIQYHHHLPDLDHRNPSPDHQEKHQRSRAAGLPERAPQDRRQR